MFESFQEIDFNKLIGGVELYRANFDDATFGIISKSYWPFINFL